jgi:hypothetical protein
MHVGQIAYSDCLFWEVMIYYKYMADSKIIRFNAYNTRRNLPAENGRKRGEANFLGSFERFATSRIFERGYGGRHFALSNYGIADFVWLVPDGRTRLNSDNPYCAKIFAFETKMKNWRRAFQQAYRFSYYSDAAFVILPPDAGKAAGNFKSLFIACNIGLWIYNHKENALKKIFSPINPAPRSNESKCKAIAAISSRI